MLERNIFFCLSCVPVEEMVLNVIWNLKLFTTNSYFFPFFILFVEVK